MAFSVIGRWTFSCSLGLLAPALALCETSPAPNDRHVVVIVWDGMRPDFVTEQNTPALWQLAHDGVTFRKHHSVFPTATNVNGAALATGVYPNRSTLLANREFRPQIKPLGPFENAEPDIIKKADEVTGGKYVASPTMAEIIRSAGRRTAVVGSKAVVFLHDRHAEWTSGTSQKDGFTKFAAAPMPGILREEMLQLLGPLPVEPASAGDPRNTYATRALTEIMWRDGLPAFSFLWLSEPDFTQHDTAPGSEPSLAALRSSDRNLALVLDALSKKKLREQTDVLVVSDHGFSTIESSIQFVPLMKAAGFDAVAAFQEKPKAGQVMVVGNGGTVLFYIVDHDRDVTARLVEWLQHSDFAGVIFTREKFEGAFTQDMVHAETADAPDVMVSMRWNAKANRFGTPGQIATDSARKAGNGSHASLSEFDVHNILFAAGPSFRRDTVSDVPSGNIDVAPTVLHLLGIKPPHKFDGRVLTEALNSRFPKPEPLSKTLDASRHFSGGEWRQHMRVSLVAETIYFDEGNGAFEPAPSPAVSPSPSP